MNESTTPTTKQFTGCASLAAIGMKLRELKLFEPIEQTVQIAQKTIKDRPTDKLYDALISMLAGAHGLVEINTVLPHEKSVLHRFWWTPCRVLWCAVSAHVRLPRRGRRSRAQAPPRTTDQPGRDTGSAK